MTATSPQRSVCARIAKRLAEKVGARRYNMWFDRTARFEYDDQENRLAIAVPNRFVADWITKRFDTDIRRVAADELGERFELRVDVNPELFSEAAARPHAKSRSGAASDSADGGASDADAPAAVTTTRIPQPRHRNADAAPTLRHHLDDFIVGPSNELAHAATLRMAEDEQVNNNPLFLHGGCGLGKTHLLQGLCARFLQRHPDARALYTTGEQFTNEFLTAVRGNKIDAFRKKIRRLHLLIVDDVHFIANKQATQQEFLHSFDAIDLGGARVVMASDCHPKLIQQFSNALVSRCVRGMVVEIRTPDTVTRARIVRALAQRRGINLLDTVVEIIASRCAGSIREIEGMLAKLHALSALSRQRQAPGADGHLTAADPIGHTIVNQLFAGDTHHTRRKAVHFDQILDACTQIMCVSRQQVMGSSRHQHVVLARSLSIHLARQMTTMSYPEIASAMGRRNHSTVITAAQRIEKQIAAGQHAIVPGTMEDVAISELIERLRHMLGKA